MKKLTFLILIICSLLACKKSPDTSKFVGNWKGNYVGQDTGTISFAIDANLNSTGSYTSRITHATEILTGRVTNNGELVLTFGTIWVAETFPVHWLVPLAPEHGLHFHLAGSPFPAPGLIQKTIVKKRPSCSH